MTITNRGLRVRSAEPADYDRIIGVADEWWGRPVRQILPRLFLDHFYRSSFVAEQQEQLAGFVVGFCSPSVPDVAYIHFAGVRPDHRRTGLARELYERFFALARAERRMIVRAVTSPRNHDSIAFHSALGFRVTGPVLNYDGPETDRIVFQRHTA